MELNAVGPNKIDQNVLMGQPHAIGIHWVSPLNILYKSLLAIYCTPIYENNKKKQPMASLQCTHFFELSI